LTEGLIRYGAPLLGALTFLETSTLIGLFVPAGVAFLLAGFLTTQGTLSLAPVIVWAVCGAVFGDTVGYWVGHRSSLGAQNPRGVLGRAFARLGPKQLAVLSASPFYSVSLARVISFLRTLAPVAAGRAELGYLRFLFYNWIGILLWALTYVAVGTLAGESWRRVSQYVGTAWAMIFLVALGVGVWVRRRGRSPASKGSASNGSASNKSAPRPPLSIGLTGNAASGKSTVAGLWRGQGVPVVDADALARDAVAVGSDGLAAVVEVLGPEVLQADGTLDRQAVRSLVFSDPDRRTQLEAILHPRIAEMRERWVATKTAEGHGLVVSEVPLLFETGLASAFDAVVLVHTPRDVSLSRLIQTRGLSPQDANAILDAQMDSSEKRAQSDYVIVNTGSKGDLEDAAMHILGTLRARAATASSGTEPT